MIEKVTDTTVGVTLTSLQVGSAHLVEPKKWPGYTGGFIDRNSYLSASEMSKCLRRTWYAKKGDTGIADFVSNGYAERGNAIEAWIVERLQVLTRQGYILNYVGNGQRTFYDVTTGISGTPDGLLTVRIDDYKHILLEFKSIDPRVNRASLPKKAHIMQVQVNMWLVSLCLGIDVQEARLLYIDASDLHKQDEFVVQRHDDYKNEAISRAMLFHGVGDAEQLQPEGLKNGDCDTCPFTGLCSAAIDTTAKAIKSGQSVGFFGLPESRELTAEEQSAVRNYLHWRDAIAEMSDREEEAKNEVKNMLIDRNSPIEIDGRTLSAAITPGRETLDTKAVAASGIDLTPFKKVGKPYVVMRVTE